MLIRITDDDNVIIIILVVLRYIDELSGSDLLTVQYIGAFVALFPSH